VARRKVQRGRSRSARQPIRQRQPGGDLPRDSPRVQRGGTCAWRIFADLERVTAEGKRAGDAVEDRGADIIPRNGSAASHNERASAAADTAHAGDTTCNGSAASRRAGSTYSRKASSPSGRDSRQTCAPDRGRAAVGGSAVVTPGSATTLCAGRSVSGNGPAATAADNGAHGRRRIECSYQPLAGVFL